MPDEKGKRTPASKNKPNPTRRWPSQASLAGSPLVFAAPPYFSLRPSSRFDHLLSHISPPSPFRPPHAASQIEREKNKEGSTGTDTTHVNVARLPLPPPRRRAQPVGPAAVRAAALRLRVAAGGGEEGRGGGGDGGRGEAPDAARQRRGAQAAPRERGGDPLRGPAARVPGLRRGPDARRGRGARGRARRGRRRPALPRQGLPPPRQGQLAMRSRLGFSGRQLIGRFRILIFKLRSIRFPCRRRLLFRTV
jgi:hypothetical protein